MLTKRRWLAACAATLGLACAPGARGALAARVEGVSAGGLHYIVQGTGSPVVLIHAFHTDAREWDEVAPVLSRSHRVVRYDVRGHGRSAGATSAVAAHEDLRALLDALELPRASLVGTSMGSGIALDFALAHPTRVERIVMVSPTVGGIRTDARLDWMTPIIAAVRAGDRARAAALWWESPFLAGTRARGAQADRYRRMVLDNARIWEENPALRRPLDPPAGARLEEMKAPLLVVVGERDQQSVHAVADTLIRRVPRARATTVSTAGHMVSTERPADLARIIADFLGARR